jgi:TldD protein
MNIIKQTDIDTVFKNMLSGGGDFTEIYFEESDVAGFAFIDKKVETASSGSISGCGLRLIKNEQTYFASCDNPSIESIIQHAKKLSGNLKYKSNSKELIKIEPSSIAQFTQNLQQYLEIIENVDKTFRQK